MENKENGDTKDSINNSDENSVSSIISLNENSLTGRSCNPQLPNELKEEDIAKIKGDAIGDTLYSERFVLKTLLKLTNLEDEILEKDKELEKDLCSLWDMTIEKDVIRLLLKHNVLELFSSVIECIGVTSNTKKSRLVEIILGIIANMCSLSETRDVLCVSPEIMSPILDVIFSEDILTLIQLMRFLYAVLVFENSGDEVTWFDHFSQKENFVLQFSFILSNSLSNTLLLHSLEALNAICTKFVVIEVQSNKNNNFRFRDLFVNAELLLGVIEAFKQLLPEQTDNEAMEETSTPTQNTQKIMNLFLEINVILSQYDSFSLKYYEPILDKVFNCITQILAPMCQPIYLLSLPVNDHGVIENINDLFLSLGDPFHEKCFSQFILIWSILDNYQKEQTLKKNQEIAKESSLPSKIEPSEWDRVLDSEDTNGLKTDELCMIILDFLTRTVKNETNNRLENSIKNVDSNILCRLYKVLNEECSPELIIYECCKKMKLSMKTVWDIDMCTPKYK